MKNKSNVLIIMADQLAAQALKLYGNPVCKTPNLDELAKQGIVFENQYNADEGLDDLNSNATPNGTVTNDSASTTSKSKTKTPVTTTLILLIVFPS